MHRLWRYILRYRVRYLRGIFCLVATATLAMSIPLLLKHAVEAIEHGAAPGQLSLYVFSIIGIALVQGVVRAGSRFMIFNVGRDIEYDLRNDLFAHLQKLSLNFYQKQFIGDLMSRLLHDLTAVRLILDLATLKALT
jgi:ATP-binding cassette subfamily B protein